VKKSRVEQEGRRKTVALVGACFDYIRPNGYGGRRRTETSRGENEVGAYGGCKVGLQAPLNMQDKESRKAKKE